MYNESVDAKWCVGLGRGLNGAAKVVGRGFFFFFTLPFTSLASFSGGVVSLP